MAATKSSKKKAGRKKTSAKAATRKKASSKKKSAVKKKSAGSKKTASRKKAAAARKKAVARRSASVKKAPPAAGPRSQAVQEPLISVERDSTKQATHARKATEGISSMAVNVGHVFALKPRVTTAYRQADFLAAKHLLRNDSFSSIEEAARSVVEKALELTRGGSESPHSRDR